MAPGGGEFTLGESAAGPAAAPEPAPLAPGDPVPAFRADLQVGRGASAGLFQVTDPARGRAFTLYDFELNVARMLDGRRRAGEVVEAGARLGIPIDLSGLNKFVRQLWRYGFLAPPGSPPTGEGAGAARPGREPWDDETRTLYQTGLRLMRQGRAADAAGYFEAILDGHPGNPEVAELLAQAQRGQGLPTRPVGGEGEAVSPPAGPPAARASAPPPSRRLLAAVVAAVALAGAGAAAVVLWPRPAPRPAPGAPPPAPARPAPAPAPPPAPAPAPAPVPAWREHAVTERAAPVLAELAAPAAGAVAWSARDGAEVEAGKAIGTLRAEVSVAAPPTAAQQQKLDELARLAAQDPVYEDFLEREKAKLRAATRVVVKPLPLLAPAAGRLERTAPDRRRVAKGAPVARVLDPATWRLSAGGAAPAAEGDACELAGDEPAQRAPCRPEAPPSAGGDAPLTVLVRRADAPWLEGARAPRLRIGPPGAAAGPAAPTGPAGPATVTPAAPDAPRPSQEPRP